MNLDAGIVTPGMSNIVVRHPLCSMGAREDSHRVQVGLELFREIGCLAYRTGHVFETGGQLCIQSVLGLSSRAAHGQKTRRNFPRLS